MRAPINPQPLINPYLFGTAAGVDVAGADAAAGTEAGAETVGTDGTAGWLVEVGTSTTGRVPETGGIQRLWAMNFLLIGAIRL